MAEYIKREDIHLALDRHYFPGELSLKETIDSVPAADVVERKKGKWKQGYCSECRYNWSKDAPIANVPNFCPNCGADMRGTNEKRQQMV